MAQDFSLAGTFKELAGDYLWSIQDRPAEKLHPETWLRMARLALMVVDELTCIDLIEHRRGNKLASYEDEVLLREEINPEYCRIVRERVKEIEG